MAEKVTQIDLMDRNAPKEQKGRSPENVKGEESPAGGISPAHPKKPKKKVMMVLILGMVVLTGGFLGADYLGYLSLLGLSKKAPSLEASPKKSEIGETLKLSPLIINLNEENGRHYLKTTIVLEVEDKKWVERIQPRMSVFTDMVILIISDKTLEDMRSNDFKERLREELLTTFNEHLGQRGIRQIYFDEFLFQ